MGEAQGETRIGLPLADTLIWAGRLVASSRVLWALGLVLGLGALSGVAEVYISTAMSNWAATPPAARADVLENVLNRPAPLLLGAIGLFVAITLFWLLAVSAEAALIHQVAVINQGQPAGLGAAWRAGWQLVPRFIAIDTVLFLPVFVIVLFVIITATAGFGGFVLAVVNGGDLGPALLAAAIGVLFELILLALAALVMLITLIWRTVAFRLAVLNDAGARASIRGAGRLLRRHWLAAAGVYLFLLAELRVFLFLLSFLSMPLILLRLPAIMASVNGQPPPPPGLTYYLLFFLLIGLRWLILSGWSAHNGTVWTLVVARWQPVSGDA